MLECDVYMARKQEIALFMNPDGSTGYVALGTETPEQVTHRLQKEGKRNILVFESKLLYWSS
jgi:hypothetical protein